MMKRALGFSVALMIGCATGAAVRDVVVPARAQAQAEPEYEYVVSDVEGSHSTAEVQQTLNRFAQAGWKLASNYGGYLVFERHRQK
jgi:hypothetical protein